MIISFNYKLFNTNVLVCFLEKSRNCWIKGFPEREKPPKRSLSNAGKSTLENDSLRILSKTVRSWYWNEYLPIVTDCNEGNDDKTSSEQCTKLKESLLQSPIIIVFKFFKSIYHSEY